MKKLIKYYIEYFYLLRKNFRHYVNYFLHDKTKIYHTFKEHGVTNLKPAHKEQWKINNKTCYFFGKINGGVEVFIKVMGENQRDCFYNERVVYDYFSSSEYITTHCPALLDSFETNGYYCLIYEAVELSEAPLNNDLFKAIDTILNEYTASGIIHTDFATVNVGKYKDKYMFFDYGTSLCPESNNIRIRNSANYNHVDFATKKSLDLIPEPDFYYDDAIHFGLKDYDRESLNFVIGKNNIYYAKLGSEIYRYNTEKKSLNSSVLILKKQ